MRLAGGIVKCKVSDNGSAPEPVRPGRGLAIIGELVGGMSGRVHASSTAEGCSFLLTFPLTEGEQRDACAAHLVLLNRKKMRRALQSQTSGPLIAVSDDDVATKASS